MAQLLFRKGDPPLRERIIGPTVKVGFLCFRSLHQLPEEVAVGVKVNATSVRRVLGIKQAIPIMMFL